MTAFDLSLPTVLLIDDSRIVVEACMDLLPERGYNVVCSGTVQDGLNAICRHPLDVVVTDWVMPDGGGETVLHFVRQHCHGLPVVVYSAHDRADAQSVALGSFAFVSKGDQLEALFNAVDRAARLRSPTLNNLVSSPLPLGELAADFLARARRALGLEVGGRPAIIVRDSPAGGTEGLRYWGPCLMPMGNNALCVDCGAPRLLGDGIGALFGRCRIGMGTRPALRQGLLEQAGQRGLLLSRVDSLEAQAQEELAHALARGTFSRAGSDAYSLNPSPLFLTVECAPSVRIAEPWYSLLKEKNAVLCDWRCIKAGEIRAGALLSQVVAENGIDVGHPESLTSALDELGVEQLLSVLRLLADALSDPARLDSEAVHTAVRRAVARPLPQGTLLPDPPVPLPHLPDYMDACESEYLRHVLQRTGGNIAQSAKIAGMGRQAIYKKLSRHDIQREGTGN